MKLNLPKNGRGSERIYLDNVKFEVRNGVVRLKPEYHRELIMPYVEKNNELQARIDAMKMPPTPTLWEIARPVVLFTSGVVLTAVLLFVSGNMR